MAYKGAQDIVLESLRGGLNDEDPPNALDQDECTIANNVEFYFSTLGERRKGCMAVDMSGSTLNTQDGIVHVTRHFPTPEEIDNELWAVGAVVDTSYVIARRSNSVWTVITPAEDLDTSSPDIFNINTQSFDEKLFWAAHLDGDVDRTLVWDGTNLRVAGLSQPGAVTVVDEGVGTFTGTRYYRVRFIKKTGSTVDLRSEPSSVTTFGPSGTGAGAEIQIPTLLGEGETHWEIEASSDNAFFYVIATLDIGTTTYNDETDLTTTDYADLGDLSEDIGAYTLLPSAKFLAVDGDRLLLGSSWVDPTLASRVLWTPTRKDPGAGNNERVNAATDYFIDLDTMEGGGLTGITSAISGSWYAFKWSHIYKLVRTGNRQDAYDVIPLSKSRGAIPGSITPGMDEQGRPCIYFLDPKTGPNRLGVDGLQQIHSVRTTWRTVNTSAEQVIARAVYYGDKQQVWWWVATADADTPNLRLVLQVDNVVPAQDGVKKGWSLANGVSAEAISACVLTETMEDQNGNTFVRTGPVMGMFSPDFLQRGDLGDTDNGNAYIAKIRTRPLFAAGLLNRWGAMTAALLAVANGDARIAVRFIKNFGLGTNEIVTDLAPVADEDYVIKTFDNLVMSDSIGTQIEFSDIEDVTHEEGTLYPSEPTS